LREAPIRDAAPRPCSTRASGVSLGEPNHCDDAIGVYDDLVKRFGEVTDPALQEWGEN
jgi:hypothetical protein